MRFFQLFQTISESHGVPKYLPVYIHLRRLGTGVSDAAIPGGLPVDDPNLMMSDFISHLNLDHKKGSQVLIVFLDEVFAIPREDVG